MNLELTPADIGMLEVAYEENLKAGLEGEELIARMTRFIQDELFDVHEHQASTILLDYFKHSIMGY